MSLLRLTRLPLFAVAIAFTASLVSLADDAAGILRVGVATNGETSVEMPVQRSDGSVTNSAFCILHSVLYFPTYDANGNISEYVSTNGEIVAHYAYSPFGELIVSSGPLATSFTHQFSTRPYCPHIEIIEYVYRKYRPEIGRWMNRDMLFSNQNAMLFALNKPVFRVDALGLYTPPEEMSFISQSQAAKADCNASIDTFWKNNPKWKSIREHFSRVKRNGKTCEVLITCTCCK